MGVSASSNFNEVYTRFEHFIYVVFKHEIASYIEKKEVKKLQLDYRMTIMEKSEEKVKKKYIRRLISSIWKINDARVNAKWSFETVYSVLVFYASK